MWQRKMIINKIASPYGRHIDSAHRNISCLFHFNIIYYRSITLYSFSNHIFRFNFYLKEREISLNFIWNCIRFNKYFPLSVRNSFFIEIPSFFRYLQPISVWRNVAVLLWELHEYKTCSLFQNFNWCETNK